MYFRASFFAFSLLAGSRVLASEDVAKLMMSDESSLTNTNGTGKADADDFMQSAVKGVKVYQNCKDPKNFALTFDDGPYSYGRELTRVLHDNKIKATFFVNGYNYGCIYDYADDLIARHKAGHIIASHTWNHADLTKLTKKQIHQEIDLVEEALWKILGVKPALFRAPYGNLNTQVKEIVAARGYKLVDWSFDSGDSVGALPSKSIRDYKNLSPLKKPGPIALNHETYPSTVHEVIPRVVPMLSNKGYKFVTVDECLGVEPYQTVGSGKGTKDNAGLEDKQHEAPDQQDESHQLLARHYHKAHHRHDLEQGDKKGYKSNKGHKGNKHHRHPKDHMGHDDSQHEAGHSKAPRRSGVFQGTPGKRDKTWTCAHTPPPGST